MSIFQNSPYRTGFILLLILGGTVGCMHQDGMVETEPPLKYVFPETPDDLMTNFVTAYTTRDAVGYADLLHEDFIFSFQACDVAKLGLSKDHFTREDEIQTARNMFSGRDYHKSNGQVVPAITEIRFERWEQLEPWHPAEESAAADVMRINMVCRVVLERGRASTIEVAGQSVFYAVPAVLEVRDAIFREGYKMVGWVDLTGPCGP